MKRRRLIVNTVLGVAVVGAGLGTYLSVSSAGQTTAQASRTVLVSKGTLTSTVTATGNAEVVTSIGVELEGSAGVVRKLYVKEGQKVVKGQKLLQIDQTSAKQALKTAKNGLRSAEASYETTTQGQTAQQLAQSNASIASSRTSLANARTGLSQARASYALDKKQQAKTVDIADDAVDAAEDALDDAKDAPTTKTTTNADGTTTTTTTDNTASINSAEAAVTSAKNSRTQAKQSRDSTLLKDRQAIETQEGQVSSAEKALSSQVAAANVASQPARAGSVKSAQVQIDNAQVAVDEAQTTLDETVLRAPAAGTVADITAVKGQSSGSSSSSSSGSTTSSSTSTSTSSTSSSTTSGLVTLTDLDKKQIEASVAEADVTKVKVGQKVAVVFAATDATVAGTVTAISTQDTVTNNVVTYAVTVTLDGKASSVRIGQSASMTITTGTATDVLIAPTTAITTTGDRSTVTRRVNGVDTAGVVVETGLVGTSGTEIVSGLAEGDTLVVATTATTSSSSTTSSSGGGGLGGVGGGGGGPR